MAVEYISLVLIAPIDTLKQRFNEREKRDMNPNEQQLTEQALDVYKRLGERFKNYFLLDSNRSVDEIYRETKQKIKERGII